MSRLTFEQLAAADGVVCTFSLNRFSKLVLTGNFVIEVHRGSYKYSDEVILSLWGLDPPVLEKRPFNHGFFRVEIPLTIPLAVALFKNALKNLGEKNATNFK